MALAFHTWRFLSLSQNTRGPHQGSVWLCGFFFRVSPAEKQPSCHIHGSKQSTKHEMQGGRGMSGLQCAGVFRLHNPYTPHHSPKKLSLLSASVLLRRNEGRQTSTPGQLQQQWLQHCLYKAPLYKAPLILATCSGSFIGIME